jgi:hypothetical protein
VGVGLSTASRRWLYFTGVKHVQDKIRVGITRQKQSEEYMYGVVKCVL